jgi:hypothetical protein
MNPDELERQRAELAEQKAKLDKLIKSAGKAKEEGRAREIRQVVAEHKGAGPRRAIEHGMKTMNMFEDVDELWDELAETAEAGGLHVATQHNLVEVNKAIDQQAEIFGKLRKHVQHEIAMQVVASKSPLAWKTVKKLEGSEDFDKEKLGIDEKEVRDAEKALMLYEKEIAAATGKSRAKKTELRGASGARAHRERGDGQPAGERKDSRRGAQGGYGGAPPPYAAAVRAGPSDAGVQCYTCGEFGHRSYVCKNPTKTGQDGAKKRKN